MIGLFTVRVSKSLRRFQDMELAMPKSELSVVMFAYVMAPQAHTFKHLVPSWWLYFERLWELCEMKLVDMGY